MKGMRSAGGEDILQGLFGTWLDLSDLSTDREKKAFTSTTLRLSTFETKELMSLENFCFVFTYNLLLWRSIVTCNRCNIVSSHKCLTRINQSFCTMSFNRKLRKYFETERPCLFYFCVDVARILNSRDTSAQAAHGQFTLGSHLKFQSMCFQLHKSDFHI